MNSTDVHEGRGRCRELWGEALGHGSEPAVALGGNGGSDQQS